jgi:hypothetical protein
VNREAYFEKNQIAKRQCKKQKDSKNRIQNPVARRQQNHKIPSIAFYKKA